MKRKNLIKYAKMAGFKNAEILLDSHVSDIVDVGRMECAAKIAKKINKQKVVAICKTINQSCAIDMNKDGVVFEQCTVNDILTLICYLTGGLTYKPNFNMNTVSLCCESCAKKNYGVYLNVMSADASSKFSKDIFRLTAPGCSCQMPTDMLDKKVLHAEFDQNVYGITVTIRISNNSVKSTYFVDKIIYDIREEFTRCQEEVRDHHSKVKPIQVKSLLGGDDRDCIDSVIKSIEKKYPSDQIRGECTSMGRIWRLVETNAYSLTPKFTVNVTPENKNQNEVDQISHTATVTNKGIFHIENCDYDAFKLHEHYRNDIQKIFKNSNDIYHVDANIKYGRQIEILMRDYFSVGTSTNAVDTGIIAAEIAICSAFLHALPAAAIEVILDDALYSEFKRIMQKLTLSMYDEKRRNYASTI
mgnify:CR=1 FL=1